MFSVYTFISEKSGKHYTGMTSVTPQRRLQQHNAGTSQWTSAHRPLRLVRVEQYPTKKQAMIRERFLKSGQGRKFLDSILPYEA